MTYRDAIRYLNSFYDYEKHPSSRIRFLNLDRIKVLAALYRNPQDYYPKIHITGTKGKGSCASILSSILTEAGYKVGLYTSPHFVSVRERLKIGDQNIEKRELTLLVKELKKRLEKLGSGFKPSFFEIYTLLAFNYFKRKKIDYGIFEVGMGGRFDATNIIMPIVTGITSISLDHTSELGGRLVDIACEKADIIKSRVDCVSAPQEKEVLEVIKKKCKKSSSRLFLVGRDLLYKSISHSEEIERLQIKGILDLYRNLKLPLLGEHQLVNCTVSIGMIEVLLSRGCHIPDYAISKGIANTRWPGRCEVVNKKPKVILDSAHNRQSAFVLKKTIRRNFDFQKLILILGISSNKDIEGICSELTELADRIILTQASNVRAARPEYIKRFFKRKDVIISGDIKKAYKISKDLARENDIILITGSIYLVGEFKGYKLT